MSDDFEELDIDLVEEEEREQSSEDGKIHLYFQSTIGPSQRQERLQVITSAPVSELKYTVSQIFSLEPSDFHLSYLGRTMDPDDVLSNYDCEDGETVLLIPVSTAGHY
ncbi:MAG: ubiquitin-like domain-containing protein [Candidatus Kariarchaeaceae archaeon]|jgi:hypothetical protein